MHSARLGLIVGKRALARAHERNRVKRIIRNRFRLARADLASVDLVIRVVRPASRQEIHEALDRVFARLEKNALEDKAST